MSRRGRRGGGGGLLVLVAVGVGMWLVAHPPLLDRAGAGFGSGADRSSAGPAVADIPPGYLALYRQSAGTCPQLDWALLAGVGKVETNHGRARAPGVSSGTNYAGAGGPMQFLRPTFRKVRGTHPELGPNLYDPAHAIPAAAHYLCDGGLRRGDVRAALWTYNHSRAYADQVLTIAARYRATAGQAS